MTKSIKAVMLSAFLFPGAGHFYLKKHIRGTVLAMAALGALCYIVSKMVERTLQIVDQILLGQVQPDVATITTLVSKQPIGANSGLYHMAWVVLIMSWLISIADAYRVGRLQNMTPNK